MLTLTEIAHPADKKVERILDAAHKNFAEHGFRRSAVDDICSDAGISKPTFYKVFQTKEELFFATSIYSLEKAFEDFYRELENFDTARDKIGLFFRYLEELPPPSDVYGREYDTNTQLRLNWLIHPLHQELQLFQLELLERFVLEGIAQDEFRAGNPKAIAQTLVMYTGAIHRLRAVNRTKPGLFPEPIHEFVTDLFINGIKNHQPASILLP
ncbi:TetR/AcrR family transcriptional regulator [candidate division WOR-3 bacterium]|nr:TetR/AcrR family transcriptional regulator [candidate division WOR-3 bacterium]